MRNEWKNTLTALLVFFSCFTLMSQSSIIGTVIDDRGVPIVGATVKILDTEYAEITDLQGNYEFFRLKNGIYEVETSFIGCDPIIKPIELTGGEVRLDFQLKKNFRMTEVNIDQEAVIEANRVDNTTPITHQNITSEEIESQNLGVDLPILLDQATSVVTTSDAGAGVGYTGMRIRGSDATRINVSINGIPLNDAESQGVFWVNMPDFASSIDDIQIQRGVGTSTNGAGAFGATVNLATQKVKLDPFATYSGGYGSFNTVKNTIEFGSGLVNEKFAVDGRLSSITSDGFIDRAASDLQSYYLNATSYLGKNTLRFVTFGGKERTYQAWYGVPQAKIDEDERTYNPYNYADQVDNYNQDHYQLHFSRPLAERLTLSVSGHYTRGLGYFEEYKGTNYNQDLNPDGSREELADYGFEPVITINDTLFETALIRRRWLDNHFYGAIYSLQYTADNYNVIFGGGLNRYEGDHFGEVIWAEAAASSFPTDRYYDNLGEKNDFNTYLKADVDVSENISLFGDLQYRMVTYKVDGIDNDQRTLSIDDELNFFNPKVGAYFKLDDANNFYVSASVANREPSRNDYVDAPAGVTPSHESMIDYELGYKRRANTYQFNANLYYMDYTDQLVLTGEVNDVGNPIRTNVDKSYRAGLELEFAYMISERLTWKLNGTFSQNKIESFTDRVDDWTNGGQSEYEMSNKTIAFSPSIIAGNIFQYTFQPRLIGSKKDELTLALITKYVGEQFIDNTESDDRKLDAYAVSDFRLSYGLENVGFKRVALNFTVKNLLNTEYIANAWVYKFESTAAGWDPSADDIYTESTGNGNYQMTGLFPQAGIHFMTGVTLNF